VLSGVGDGTAGQKIHAPRTVAIVTVMIQRICRSFFVGLAFVEASEINMPLSVARFGQNGAAR
jgi:hypothetical protein